MGLKFKKNLVCRKIEEKIFIIDPENEKMHSLNETAAYIWENLERGFADKKIISGLEKEFEISKERAGDDFKNFVLKLRQENLLL